MENKTTKLKELFEKWYAKQQTSGFENSDHFSVDGLIKADDEDCVVLFVLSEPHIRIKGNSKFDEDFWFRRVWEDCDALYSYEYDKPSDTKGNRRNIKLYKKRIELCAKSLGIKEEDIPHGIAVMDMKKCGGGPRLPKKVFYKYVGTFAGFIKNQIEIINPQCIVASGDAVYNALLSIGLEKYKIIKIWHLGARKKNSEFELLN